MNVADARVALQAQKGEKADTVACSEIGPHVKKGTQKVHCSGERIGRV